MKISAKVTRGNNYGATLHPHLYRDGKYVVSLTRYKKDQIKVSSLADVQKYLEIGFSLRMSNKNEGVVSPSLIVPSNISF